MAGFIAKELRRRPIITKSIERETPPSVIARSSCDEAIQGPRDVAPGLLRFARNDGLGGGSFIFWLRLTLASIGVALAMTACLLPSSAPAKTLRFAFPVELKSVDLYQIAEGLNFS